MHALIIEDQPSLSLTIEQGLRAMGCRTFDHAESIDEALAAAMNRCPDLIVADHELMNGTGTGAALAICSGQQIPVVFATASPDRVRAALPEAVVLAKPFSMQELNMAVAGAQRRPFASP